MFKPRVTIGIPTLNGPERLSRCLESIADCTAFERFESVKVIVNDDASTSENLKLNKDAIHRSKYLREIAGLEMLVSEERRGVSTSWNRLVRHQDQEIVVLLNDDLEVDHDWLDVLTFSVWENPLAGMVGLNCYIGTTKLQAKMAGLIPPKIDYHEATMLDGGGKLLTPLGSIFAIRRDVFDMAGGFDERYFVFYEEVDMAVTLRKSGYHQYIASYPIVFHMGGATTSEPTNIDAKECLRRSRQLFSEKWGETPGEFREKCGTVPKVREWNTQLKFLID